MPRRRILLRTDFGGVMLAGASLLFSRNSAERGEKDIIKDVGDR